jgi:hypothetical protein
MSESHSQVRISKQLCDKFPVHNVLKQEVSSSFLCDFVGQVHPNKDIIKSNGTHTVLV